MSTTTPGFSLIETMRHEPATGIVRQSLHRTRLANSSRKLGFAGHEDAWAAAVAAEKSATGPSRLRLELFSNATFEITVAPFVPLQPDCVWRLALARDARLDSTVPTLRHKTSLRSVYEAARAEYDRDDIDEVLLRNEKGDVCEGTITNLFLLQDGILLTPPLSTGCLAGVLRTSLLCAKKARVAPVRPDDLEGKDFYVGNSLRGLIRARLAG